jgi:hypothetical protein
MVFRVLGLLSLPLAFRVLEVLGFEVLTWPCAVSGFRGFGVTRLNRALEFRCFEVLSLFGFQDLPLPWQRQSWK